MKAPLQPKTENATIRKFGIPEMIGAAVLMLILGSLLYALIKSQLHLFA